jgi:hypothetical protein
MPQDEDSTPQVTPVSIPDQPVVGPDSTPSGGNPGTIDSGSVLFDMPEMDVTLRESGGGRE